jgi:hypothetical protein
VRVLKAPSTRPACLTQPLTIPLLESDRAERRRYLADFLAVERDATDTDLRGQRANADTLMVTGDTAFYRCDVR